MTVPAVLCFLALLVFFGLVPALVLLPKDLRGHRILFLPILGLSSGTLMTFGLAPLNLTGRTIAIVALVLFFCGTVLVAVGKARVPWVHLASKRLEWRRVAVVWFDREELKGAAAPLLSGAASMLLIGWPLFYQGLESYWGFANPDAPFYLAILEHLHSNPFGMPGIYSGLDLSAILGISYFFSMLTVITRIPIEQLFGVACSGVLFLIPLSTCLLGEIGFGLRRPMALTASFVIAGSSIVANTFYLHSLGALSVVALVPAGLTVAILYTRSPELKNAFLLVLVVAAMYYCYFPGFGVLGVAIGAVVAAALIRRRLSVRDALVPAALAAVVTGSLFFPHARTILNRLVWESLSGRLAVSPTSDEVVLSFAPALTEELVPFFWGLKNLNGISVLPGHPDTLFLLLFALGGLLSGMMALSLVRRTSGLAADYAYVLLALLAVVAIYVAGGNGYGVFKLTAWVQPLVILGLTATCLGVAHPMWSRGAGLLSFAPVLLLLTYAGLNVAQTVLLGLSSTGLVEAATHHLPAYDLKSVRELSKVSAISGQQPLALALPDPVLQRWVIPYLGLPRAQFAPVLTLNVEDSNSESRGWNAAEAFPDRRSGFLLHLDQTAEDIAPAPPASPVWRAGKFALTPLDGVRNGLWLGMGWYRLEHWPGAQFAWQKRLRWLRKRAEAILVNPDREPQRLRLTLFAGEGNPSPGRHVVIWADGRKLDEFEFSGYARLLSRPFVTSSFWTHLELEVQESAGLIPRQQAFWNDWIPRDPRRLNVAVSEIALVPDRDAEAGLATVLDLSSDTRLTSAFFDGIYPDLWIGKQAAVTLRLPPGAEAIEIAGTMPGERTLQYPYRIHALANGTSLGDQAVSGPGPFQLRFPLNTALRSRSSPSKVVIVLQPESTFVPAEAGLSADPRSLSFILRRVEVVKGPPTLGAGAWRIQEFETKTGRRKPMPGC
jgi:hypothetical protein